MPSSIGSSPPARRPSWRRLLVGTTVVFLVVLAFLAGRLRAGLDPAQATQSAKRVHATTVTRAANSSATAAGSQASQSSASASGATSSAPAATTPDPSPPTTHAS